MNNQDKAELASIRKEVDRLSAELDGLTLRARARAVIREITLPREVAEGLDPREPLPLSIPVRFKRKVAR